MLPCPELEKEQLEFKSGRGKEANKGKEPRKMKTGVRRQLKVG